MNIKFGIVAVGLVLVHPVFATVVSEVEAIDSIGLIEKPATISVKSPEDLRALIRGEQETYTLLAPPSLSPYWSRIKGDVFVEWEEWGEARKLAFAYLDRNMIPRYEIKVWEDFNSGAIFVVNGRNEIMARLEQEKGFNPYGFWLKSQSRVSSVSELSDFEQILYSSSHTALSLTLTPYSFAEVCADIRDEGALLASSLRYEEEGMAMMSSPKAMGSGVELQMGIGRSNGTVEVFVEWLSSLDSDSLDLFHATDLIAANWQLQTNFPTASSTNFYFQDLETNQTARFYVTGTMYDEDLDGLSSARERYLHKTREDLWDTSGDGCGDGWLVQYGFNPLALNTLGDVDNDGFSNLEEQNKGTDPTSPQGNSNTGTVATIRYYYDEDDRLIDFFCGAEVAEKTLLTAAHNIAEEVSAK